MTTTIVLIICGLLIVFSTECIGSVEQETGMEIGEYVPTEIKGWEAEGPGEFYDKKGIFRYLNGAGEVYLSYSFRELFVKQFAKGDLEPITVELFDMGAAADAFGVFTRGRRGGDAGVGQGSEYSSGYLIFWKDKYFVSVYAFEETPETKEVIFELGRAIAGAIPGEGALPGLIDFLPAEGMVGDSVRYFHRHTCLNYHYFLADDNILDLSENTEAALAEYSAGESKDRFLIVRYPGGERARKAYRQFIETYLPEGGTAGLAELEDGTWTAAALREEFFLAVFDAGTEDRAKGLLASVISSLERGNHDR